MNNYQESENQKDKKMAVDVAENTSENAVFEAADEEAAKAAKEARKMKIRKVLYPIAIIAIILLWVSSFLDGK